ncbi:S-adenosyl-L-methionine-dependent methyltransferase [Pelagophyceae sp. CCMP2097]|nr:S-adenosyl-L-methionine-dependent methyltransferase [Pelagophyceae sp. CCMP2097]
MRLCALALLAGEAAALLAGGGAPRRRPALLAGGSAPRRRPALLAALDDGDGAALVRAYAQRLEPCLPFEALALGRDRILETDWWTAFEAASTSPLRVSCRLTAGLRGDGAKTAAALFRQLALDRGWQLEQVPWDEDGFFVASAAAADGMPRLGVEAAHVAGRFYVQEAGAMLPVSLLVSSLSDSNAAGAHVVVVDACAAPGGKTVQLVARLRRKFKATVIANEKSSSRLGALAANLARCGAGPHVALSHAGAVELFDALPDESCDAVLCDAPCSGDAQARRELSAGGLAAHLRSSPSDEGVADLATVQASIIQAAWRCVKPGGTLVYSTCSLLPVENEDVVRFFLKAHEDADCDEASDVVRLWPQMHDTAGFFAARISKRRLPDDNAFTAPTDDEQPLAGAALEAARKYFKEAWLVDESETEASPFADALFADGEASALRLTRRKAELWLVPTRVPSLQGLRYNRRGIKVLEALTLRGAAPKPTDAGLATALAAGHVRCTHEWALACGLAARRRVACPADQVADYLKGVDVEPLGAEALPEGQVLVVDERDSWVLGLAKKTRGSNLLKNQLPKDVARRDLRV